MKNVLYLQQKQQISNTVGMGKFSNAVATLLCANALSAKITFPRLTFLTRLTIRSPGLMVMGDNSCLRGCGFKSRFHIIGWALHFSHWVFVKCIVCSKRPKINEKETGVGPLKIPLTKCLLTIFYCKNCLMTTALFK